MAFCPNCGTANTEQAEKCVACGHELTQQQRARFKGTIMMSGTQLPAGVVPKPSPAAAPAAPPAAPEAEASPKGAAQGAPKAFAKTMLGAAISLPTAGVPSASGSDPKAVRGAPADLGSAATMHSAAVPYARTVEAPQLPSQPLPSPAVAPAAVEPPRVESARRDATPSAPFPTPAIASHAAPPAERSQSQSAATVDAPLPGYAGAQSPAASSAGGNSSKGYGGQPSIPPTGRDFAATSMAAPKAGPGKAILFGCAGALAVAALSGLAIYMFARDSVSGLLGGSDAQVAAAWRKSVGQAVEQVAQLCTQDCSAAGIYFHPQTQAALLSEAKQLTPERARKFATGADVSARMLSDSDDGAIATKLNLDPARCVQLVLGQAQVVGCSVIDSSGVESLRLVHLAGVSTL